MLENLVCLYVEDDEFNRQALKLVFTRMLGIEDLVIFEDSSNFIARVEALPKRPNLFLLDVQVRPYDGFEMLRMLRAHEHYKDARIAAVTASVMNDQIEQLRDVGFDGCLGKPLLIRSLGESIERIVRGEKIWQVVG